jgi:hypothetical protein
MIYSGGGGDKAENCTENLLLSRLRLPYFLFTSAFWIEEYAPKNKFVLL